MRRHRELVHLRPRDLPLLGDELGAQALRDELEAVEQLRAGNRAYLSFLIDEEPYARMFFLETLAAGPEAVARARACRRSFAETVRAWHEYARHQQPDWPPASDVE